jgi:hypothetical protein
MVIKGELVNHPSDHAKPDGTGGKERQVCNALLIYYEPSGSSTQEPGKISKEQQELNIKY